MTRYKSTHTDQEIFLVNKFVLQSGNLNHFKALWKNNADIMCRQTGFIEAWLLSNEAIRDEDQPIVIYNFALWKNGYDFDQARKNPEWHRSIDAMLNDDSIVFSNEVIPTTELLHVLPPNQNIDSA